MGRAGRPRGCHFSISSEKTCKSLGKNGTSEYGKCFPNSSAASPTWSTGRGRRLQNGDVGVACNRRIIGRNRVREIMAGKFSMEPGVPQRFNQNPQCRELSPRNLGQVANVLVNEANRGDGHPLEVIALASRF